VTWSQPALVDFAWIDPVMKMKKEKKKKKKKTEEESNR
jgi:hypothetical protein